MIPKHKHQSNGRCKAYCDTAGIAALTLIQGNAAVKALSIAAIRELQAKCRSCCKGKSFYMDCIRPLERYVQPTHDHMFPDEDDDLINNYNYKVHTPETWARDVYRDNAHYWHNVYNNRIY